MVGVLCDTREIGTCGKPDLEATASIIRAGTSRGLMMLVYANNHFEGCAPLTLERLLGILREAPKPS